MAVKIRLKRMGKIRAPFYRVVVMDSRTKRDGRAIEEIGKYHPTQEPSLIEIDSERAQHWLSNGAQPTEAALALLKVTGDWQKFSGLEGTEGTLRVREPKRSKKDLYEAAVAAAGGSTLDVKEAPTRKRAAPAKAAARAADATRDTQADAPQSKARRPTATEPKADVTPDEPKADVTPDEPKADVTPDEPNTDVTPDEPKTDVTPDETPVSADTDSGAASAQSVDTDDDPSDTSSSATDDEKSES